MYVHYGRRVKIIREADLQGPPPPGATLLPSHLAHKIQPVALGTKRGRDGEVAGTTGLGPGPSMNGGTSASTNADDDDVLIEMEEQLSTQCPISNETMVIPARGANCKHLTCFDLRTFLVFSLQAGMFQCPHCNNSILFKELAVSERMKDVLKDLPDGVTLVTASKHGPYVPFVKKAKAASTSGPTTSALTLGSASTTTSTSASTFVSPSVPPASAGVPSSASGTAAVPVTATAAAMDAGASAGAGAGAAGSGHTGSDAAPASLAQLPMGSAQKPDQVSNAMTSNTAPAPAPAPAPATAASMPFASSLPPAVAGGVGAGAAVPSSAPPSSSTIFSGYPRPGSAIPARTSLPAGQTTTPLPALTADLANAAPGSAAGTASAAAGRPASTSATPLNALGVIGASKDAPIELD